MGNEFVVNYKAMKLLLFCHLCILDMCDLMVWHRLFGRRANIAVRGLGELIKPVSHDWFSKHAGMSFLTSGRVAGMAPSVYMISG